MKILIVDDSQENLYMLETLLKKCKHSVEMASNGRDGLKMVLLKRFDLIVSDILMPFMDGFQFCRLVKGDEKLKSIPFIFYTATYTDKKDEDLAFKIGADGFIIKPQEPEVFMKTVDRILEDRQKRQLSGAAAKTPPDRKPLPEATYLKEYNERLIHKLEEKVLEVERINRLLQANEALLQTIIESAPECVKLVDDKGKILQINPAGLSIIDAESVEQVINLTMDDLVIPEDREAFKALRESVFRGKRGILEFQAETLKGHRRYLQTHAVPLRNADGIIIAELGLTRDITLQKLLLEQLLQSQKMEGIGRLAGGVAHDFNNLLTAVIGYSEYLLESVPPESPLHSPIQEILRSGERAAALTSQLLAFSRKQLFSPRIVQPNTIISQITEMLQRLIGEDVLLETFLDPATETIQADPHQIEQVLMNLAVNSRDAMPNGGRILIETQNVVLTETQRHLWGNLLPNNYVQISVRDTGCGMDPEVRTHLFEPFFTTKAQGKGTGLGLSTVYGIVKQSGGEIKVESEPNLGTTFRIYFPRALAGSEEPALPTPPVRDLSGQETILVVEDQENVRKLIVEVLKSKGYSLLEAGNGEEAMVRASQHTGPIQLLITDIVMPGMGGKELAKRFSADHRDSNILFISGYAHDKISQNDVQNGARAFLQKPFTITHLVTKVREILDHGKS